MAIPFSYLDTFVLQKTLEQRSNNLYKEARPFALQTIKDWVETLSNANGIGIDLDTGDGFDNGKQHAGTHTHTRSYKRKVKATVTAHGQSAKSLAKGTTSHVQSSNSNANANANASQSSLAMARVTSRSRHPWELDVDDLVIQDVIGSGSQGQVGAESGCKLQCKLFVKCDCLS